MSASFDLEGGKELQDALDALPEKTSKNYMDKALRAGAVPVLALAKQICPVASTNARGYVTRRTKSKEKVIGGVQKLGAYAKVAPGFGRDQLRITRGGPQKIFVESGDAYYLNMVEWGTKKIKTPNPFMTQALEGASGDASELIAASLKADIEAEFSKGA